MRNKSEHNSVWGHCISIGLRSHRQYAACKLCAHMLLDCCWHPTQPYWALKSSGHVVMGSRIVSPDHGVEKGHKWCTLVQKNPERHIGYRSTFPQYRRKFWWVAIIFAICGEFSSANLCESPILSPYTVIYLLFQLSWLLVPCLIIYFGDFLCDLFVELPNFSQILVTSTVIIFVFLPVLLPNLVIIFKH